MDPVTRELDFDDNTLAVPARRLSAFLIPNASETGTAGHPQNIIMLIADASAFYCRFHA